MNNVISKVFDSLEKDLCLINYGRGGNYLVESKRALKYEKPKLDHQKNIWYQKEAMIGFVDDIIAEDNVRNDDDGDKVELEPLTM